MGGRRLYIAALAAACALGSGTALAAKAPANWEGLALAKSKRFDAVYLQPGADFRGYTKVMLDPTEVAFEKNWRRDYNTTTMGLSSRVSEADLQKTIARAVEAANDIFIEAAQEAGYPVVTEPGPDVLRVRTGVVNIRVNAPERRTAGRSYSFSDEAGQATLVVEVRDSMTGAVLGRAVDGRVVGDNMTAWRTSVSNRSDFRIQVKKWAEASMNGLNELKKLSPTVK
jgi:hypothetical protein